jgi:hypothetical protein
MYSPVRTQRDERLQLLRSWIALRDDQLIIAHAARVAVRNHGQTLTRLRVPTAQRQPIASSQQLAASMPEYLRYVVESLLCAVPLPSPHPGSLRACQIRGAKRARAP